MALKKSLKAEAKAIRKVIYVVREVRDEKIVDTMRMLLGLNCQVLYSKNCLAIS